MMFSVGSPRNFGEGCTRCAAREALAAVVVGVADQIQPDAAREERAEALAGRAGQAHVHGLVRQPSWP
jgi:hypothetical protein